MCHRQSVTDTHTWRHFVGVWPNSSETPSFQGSLWSWAADDFSYLLTSSPFLLIKTQLLQDSMTNKTTWGLGCNSTEMAGKIQGQKLGYQILEFRQATGREQGFHKAEAQSGAVGIRWIQQAWESEIPRPGQEPEMQPRARKKQTGQARPQGPAGEWGMTHTSLSSFRGHRLTLQILPQSPSTLVWSRASHPILLGEPCILAFSPESSLL